MRRPAGGGRVWREDGRKKGQTVERKTGRGKKGKKRERRKIKMMGGTRRAGRRIVTKTGRKKEGKKVRRINNEDG